MHVRLCGESITEFQRRRVPFFLMERDLERVRDRLCDFRRLTLVFDFTRDRVPDRGRDVRRV